MAEGVAVIHPEPRGRGGAKKQIVVCFVERFFRGVRLAHGACTCVPNVKDTEGGNIAQMGARLADQVKLFISIRDWAPANMSRRNQMYIHLYTCLFLSFSTPGLHVRLKRPVQDRLLRCPEGLTIEIPGAALGTDDVGVNGTF